MRVGYHSTVQKDVNCILRRYDKESSRLGDEFWDELNRYIKAAVANPLRFHPFISDLRRANLKRFPYSFSLLNSAGPHSHHRRSPPQTESTIRASAQIESIRELTKAALGLSAVTGNRVCPTSAAAAKKDIPVRAFSTALAFYDQYRSAVLPANLLQAKRDYFGAHTYEGVDKPRGEFFHTNWTGRGGTTASGTYTV